MKYPNTKKKKRHFIILFGALVALFFAILLFKGFPPFFLKKGALFLTKPVLVLKNNTTRFVENKIALLKNKEEIKNENNFLRQKILELETKEKFFQPLFEENKKLKEALSIIDEKKLILASILSRPGYGIYNSLIIAAGTNQGVEKGMPVTAFGNVLLGYVSETTSDAGKVKLISYPEEEINILIDNRITGIAIGLGGENMKIILPNDIKIEVGNNISGLGARSLLLGVVEEIIKKPTDPFQEILFRLPINIQEIQNVFLIK